MPPLDPDAVAQAKLAGSLWRCYRNLQTGDVVSVLLVCGRPGPVSLHTPDACYGGAGYDMAGSPVRCDVPAAPAAPATFWTARFRKSGTPVPSDLHIYWSWNAKGAWEAADNPRLTFAGASALYKLYVICDAPPPDAPEAKDPGREFIGQFLPALQKALSPTAGPDNG